MKIAVIGAGISGLTAAYYLHKNHDVKVFEKEPVIGGHTATVDVNLEGQDFAIDTGFIVFNDWTYPNFIRLLDELGVASQKTSMSFSVRCEKTGLEYAGGTLNSLFAQRKNIVNPKFLKMISEILKFNKNAVKDFESGILKSNMTLGEYLWVNGYSDIFASKYLVPMGCAIWSASTKTMLDFPLEFFVRFFKNHGLLSIKNRPQWRVIKGGSREYLPPLIGGFKNNIQTGAQIECVERLENSVRIRMKDGSEEVFDQLIMACHSDQALSLLSDASYQEKSILGTVPYQENEVVLHTDSRLLPKNKRAWSSWNYFLGKEKSHSAVLTYNMNILQGISSKNTFCVTLNDTHSIDASKIIRRFNYAHPVFSVDSAQAVNKWVEINGVKNTWFAGAYWGNGFHEDGVVSALRVVEAIEAKESSSQGSKEKNHA